MITVNGTRLYVKDDIQRMEEFEKQREEAGRETQRVLEEFRKTKDRIWLLTWINIALAIFQVSMLLLLIVRIR